MCSQVALFKEAGLPLDAIPYKALEKGDSIVVRCTSTDEDTGALIEEYWYGVVGLLTKKGTWIKFYRLGEESNTFIGEEKYELKLQLVIRVLLRQVDAC